MNEPDYIDMRGAKYETHLKWLKDPRFVKELEGDNIESDVIEEELATLKHLDNPLTPREKIVKFLRSNPVQIILCIFVLLDASIVVTQILLDINSVKERLHTRDKEFLKLWTFLKDEFGETMPQVRKHHTRQHRTLARPQSSLDGSPTENLLSGQTTSPYTQTGRPRKTSITSSGHARQKFENPGKEEISENENNLKRGSPGGGLNLARKKRTNETFLSSPPQGSTPSKSTPLYIPIDSKNHSSVVFENRKISYDDYAPAISNSNLLKNKVNKIPISRSSDNSFDYSRLIPSSNLMPSEFLTPREKAKLETFKLPGHFLSLDVHQFNGREDGDSVQGLNSGRMADVPENIWEEKNRSREGLIHSRLARFSDRHSGDFSDETNDSYVSSKKADGFKRAAHMLHHISIAILAFLVFEDLVRLIALGKSICHHKIEIFDAIIICASFAVGVFYLGGVTGDDGQQAVVALFVLLVWRVARAVDGIIMTVKQRQEFRIRLQSRVRRKAEKLLEAAESEKNSEVQHLEALQELCLKAGIKQEDILSICNLKGQKRLSWMLHALSTVARLSVGMSIFPSFGLYRHVSDWCLNVSPNKKYSRMGQHSKDRSPSPQNPPKSDPRRISSCSTQEASSSYLGLPHKYFTNQELSSYSNRRLSDVLTTVSDTSEYRDSICESKYESAGLMNKLQMMDLQVTYDNNISSAESLGQMDLPSSNCDNKKTKTSNGSRKAKTKFNQSAGHHHRKKSFKLKQFFKDQLKSKDNCKAKSKKETFFLEQPENKSGRLKDKQKSKI